MRRLIVVLAALLALPIVAGARERRFGYCQVQNTGARVIGCTVQVTISGTLNTATIYSDNLGTPLASTFVANPQSGLWFFYADNGRYDITFSGGSPTISPAYTLSDLLFLDLDGTSTFTGSSFSSASANIAQSGVLRLASGDTVAWRNTANNGDVSINARNGASGNVPADVIQANGTGFMAPFFVIFSGTSAASGALRLQSADSINWRNAANTADSVLFKLSGSSGNFPVDTLIYESPSGNAGAFSANPIIIDGSVSSVAASGSIRMHSSDAITWRNAANTADLVMNLSGADQLQLNSFVGVKGNYFQTGTSPPALSGDIRMPNGDAIKARNAANTADATLISLDSNNLVNLGDSSTAPFVPSGSLTGGAASADFGVSPSVANVTGNGGNLNLAAANGGGVGSTFGGNVNLNPGNSSGGTRNGQVIVSAQHYFFPSSYTFAQLGTPTNGNGALVYCSDCTIANPCAGGGTGAMAKRLNGVWVCN